MSLQHSLAALCIQALRYCDREINIAEYNLARSGSGGKAMAIITVDSPLDAETLGFLRSYREMEEVKQVKL